MRRCFVAIAVLSWPLLALAPANASVGTLGVTERLELMPGVRLAKLEYQGKVTGARTIVHAAIVEPGAQAEITTVMPKGSSRAPTGELCPDCLVTVNGGMFTGDAPVANTDESLLWSIVKRDAPGRILGANRILLKDGIPQELADDEFSNTPHPRTVIASSGTGSKRKVFLLVFDGRQPWSLGVTLDEARSVAWQLGADLAFNLDGGCSSNMVVQRSVWNSPCEASRPVANGIGIKALAPPAPPAPPPPAPPPPPKPKPPIVNALAGGKVDLALSDILPVSNTKPLPADSNRRLAGLAAVIVALAAAVSYLHQRKAGWEKPSRLLRLAALAFGFAAASSYL